MNLRLVKTRLQQHIALFGPRIGVSCWSRDEHTDGERRRYRRRNTILIGNKLYDRDSAVRNNSIVNLFQEALDGGTSVMEEVQHQHQVIAGPERNFQCIARQGIPRRDKP